MQPTPPAQDEGRGVDLARVRATILASLSLAGLDNMKDAIGLYLSGAQGRLVTANRAVDLGVLWQPFRDDPEIDLEAAGATLLLASLYIEHAMKVSVQVPDEARPLMDQALGVMADLESRTGRLIVQVTEILRTAPTPIQSGQNPVVLNPDALLRPGRRPGEGAGGKPGARGAQAQNKGKGSKASLATNEDRIGVRANELLALAASVLVLVGLSAYWGWQFFGKKQPPTPGSEVVAPIIPLMEMRYLGNRVWVKTKDDAFFEFPRDQQLGLAKQVAKAIRASQGMDLEQVLVVSGKTPGRNVVLPLKAQPKENN